MKNMLTLTVICLTVIAFFTSPEHSKDYSNKAYISDVNKPSLVEEKEEYFEDYIHEYVETECQDCLNFAMNDCMEVDAFCLENSDCVNWFSCVGWCEADESENDCYKECDEAYVDSYDLNSTVKLCACLNCSKECKNLCGR
jgi:hypothetical protein